MNGISMYLAITCLMFFYCCDNRSNCSDKLKLFKHNENIIYKFQYLGGFNKPLSTMKSLKDGVFSLNCEEYNKTDCVIFIGKEPFSAYQDSDNCVYVSKYRSTSNMIFFNKNHGAIAVIDGNNQKAAIISSWSSNRIWDAKFFGYGKFLFIVFEDNEHKLVRNNVLIFNQENFSIKSLSVVKEFKLEDGGINIIQSNHELAFDTVLNSVILNINKTIINPHEKEKKISEDNNYKSDSFNLRIVFDANSENFIDTSFQFHEEVKQSLGMSDKNYERIRKLHITYPML